MAIEWIKRKKDILLFMGSPGVGKTYFCSALIPWIWDKCTTIRAWSEQDFLSKLRQGMTDGYDFHREIEYRSDDEFMIYDDMGSATPSDWKKDVLFTLIDIRYSSRLPTVITTNLTEDEIKNILGYRTHSRLFDKRNLIINLHGCKDKRQDESRIQIDLEDHQSNAR